ncbi:MAG TPA: tetratricopeptide repeat protein [Draconibacterium sp.]|nr:tetratricopeptide repeat protein [Draconibacterium sp.]
MRILFLFFLIVFIIGCSSENKRFDQLLSKTEIANTGHIQFLNPVNGSVFPPEFPSPTFLWEDNNPKSKQWLVNIKINQTENIISAFVTNKSWKPDYDTWERIKNNSSNKPVTFTVAGIESEKGNEVLSLQKINITISTDSVGSPVFFRAVPLPFNFATSHLDSIKYMLGSVASPNKPKILLENLPVCGNCHSFSPDGKSFAMDVDAFGDKGSYFISNVGKEVILKNENFITWSDFQEKSTMALLSQISPNSKYVVSTLDDNEIFENRDQLEYSQLFFPIKGILAVYDIENKTFKALPGADDTTFVQSNSHWSPDNKTIYFARSTALPRKQSGMTYGTGIYDINKFQAVRDSFLSGKKEFKFDLMKIPFNDGKGGKPEFVEGASQNNKSNYFPKISPDGKWMVFCQANNYMLLQPDSKLFIVPTDGSVPPRLMNCNTTNLNSWHSWSPNNRWLVFSSKKLGAYTQLFLTHIDENGNDSPPIWLEYFKVDHRAANIPEFVNTDFEQFDKITDEFSDVADYNVRGTSKAQFGNFKEAIMDFNKALQVNQNDDQAYANRGKAKDELGDLDGAIADLNKAIELKPEEHDYYIHRGNTKVKMKNYNGAIDDCNKAISLEPKDAALYAHRAGIYQLSANYENALADFSRAIGLKPTYALYYMHRATLYDHLNQNKNALQDIDKSIKLEPRNVKYINMKGIFSKKYGETKSAIECFNKAISINPNYYEPYMELATVYDANKNYIMALENFSNAIKFYDKESRRELANLYNSRGTIYGKTNDFTSAINDFNLAISYWSNFDDAYSNRAFAKFNLGQNNEALIDCNMALQINPGMKKAMLIKDMIQKK